MYTVKIKFPGDREFRVYCDTLEEVAREMQAAFVTPGAKVTVTQE